MYVDFSKESCQELKELLDTNQNNMFLPQIELLNAFCQAQNSDKKTFINELKKISKKHPESTISNRVDSIVLILKGELDFNPKSIYINELNAPHYFFLTIDDISLNLPETQMAISKFNNINYKLDSLETTNTLLNKTP